MAILAFILHNWEMMEPAELAQRLRDFGMWGPLIIIVLMILHSFVPIPAEVLALAAGAVFGTLAGAFIIWVGAMLGAVLSYWLAYRFGEIGLRKVLSEKRLKTLDHWSSTPKPIAMLVARFIPMIAFNLINYAAGLARIPFVMFAWTTALGIIPIVFLSTYLGSQMRSMNWTMLLIVSAICIFAVLLFWIVARVYKTKKA